MKFTMPLISPISPPLEVVVFVSEPSVASTVSVFVLSSQTPLQNPQVNPPAQFWVNGLQVSPSSLPTLVVDVVCSSVVVLVVLVPPLPPIPPGVPCIAQLNCEAGRLLFAVV